MLTALIRVSPVLLIAVALVVTHGRGLTTMVVQRGWPRAVTLEELLGQPPAERWVRLEGCLPDLGAGRVYHHAEAGYTAYLPLRAAGREAEPARVVFVSRDGRLIGLLGWIADNPGSHNLAGILHRYPDWQGPLTVEGIVRDADGEEVRVLGRAGLTLDPRGGPGPGSVVGFLVGAGLLVLCTLAVTQARRARATDPTPTP